ncbi:MAG: DEAD/DEAH box helicase [Bacteriovoracia bacterium]
MQNFNELSLSAPVMKAIQELGYETPTPIQAETLPLLLGADTDFLGLAATGTGKTAAFGIPLLERIDKKKTGVQALILCPTRELAIQVAGQIDLLGKHLGIKSLPVYGGTGYREQIDGLKYGATVVVGTPGRVVDHIDKGTLKLNNLKTLILDEADEMISMGFKEDLEKVLQAAPKGQSNIWLFSATMSGDVRGVADAYLKNPKKVQVNRTEMVPDTVEQIFYKTHEYDKPELLTKIIDAADDFYGIVFCQTKALVADVNSFLSGKGYRVDCLHGDLDQTARDRVMKGFRDRKISVLIATDVACRGLDVKDITHVVNYSIPRELDNYVHRIGRTGRSGKKGVAISLVTFSHRELLGRIERMTKSKINEGVIPTARDIAMKRITNVQKAFDAAGPQGRATAILPEEWKTALKEMSPEDVAGRFLALMLPDMFSDKKTEKMADSRPAAPKGDSERGARAGRPAPRSREDSERPRFDKPKFSDRKFSDRPKFSDKPRFSENPAYGEKRSYQPRAAGADTRLPPWKRKAEGHSSRPTFSDKTPGARYGSKPSFKPFSAQQQSAPKTAAASEAKKDYMPPSLGGDARPKKKKFVLKKWVKDGSAES